MKMHRILEIIRTNHISNMHEFGMVQRYLPELGLPTTREFLEQALNSWLPRDAYDGSSVNDKMLEAAMAAERDELRLNSHLQAEHYALMDKLHVLEEFDRKHSASAVDLAELQQRAKDLKNSDNGVW